MKRREPLNLAHVLEDRPAPRLPVPVREQRIHTRFDKAFLVVIESEIYGDTFGIARNVSAGGILVEMPYAPPLGTVVTVHFQCARDDDQLDEITVRAEVKHHHYLNFAGGDDAASMRAIGLRFMEFLGSDDRVPPERWH